MKRNKNDAVASKNKTPENKESLNGNGIPSEKINTDSNDERGLPFKKVLYGFNPEEVQAFISELSQSYEASLKLHESKLSAMKEELAFSNRERDLYIKKCKEYQSQAQDKVLPVEDEADEYNIIIAQLKENVGKLEAENERLRAQQTASVSDYAEKYAEKIAILESENAKVQNALISEKARIEELERQAEEYALISEEYKCVKQELENTKSSLLICEKDLETKCDEAKEKDEKLNALAAEKNEAEKKITELEVNNCVLTQRIAESEEEISKLYEINKAITFENAERISALESEKTKIKLDFSKERKLYGYYVDRAELTIVELTKQIEQIKESISGSEI